MNQHTRLKVAIHAGRLFANSKLGEDGEAARVTRGELEAMAAAAWAMGAEAEADEGGAAELARELVTLPTSWACAACSKSYCTTHGTRADLDSREGLCTYCGSRGDLILVGAGAARLARPIFTQADRDEARRNRRCPGCGMPGMPRRPRKYRDGTCGPRCSYRVAALEGRRQP